MPPSCGGWVDQDGIIRYAQPGENIVHVMMMTKVINYVDEADDDDDDDDYHDDDDDGDEDGDDVPQWKSWSAVIRLKPYYFHCQQSLLLWHHGFHQHGSSTMAGYSKVHCNQRDFF